MRAAVVVGGDLGRSPRICYHAFALAELGYDVDLIGHPGAALHPRLSGHPRIHCHRLPQAAHAHSIAGAAARLINETFRLGDLLLRGIPAPDLILVQNPPALPILPLAIAAARRHGARLCIDWHNFSHSVLAMKLGGSHWTVRALEHAERFFGSRADFHLSVSRALQTELTRRWGVSSTVLYDRPFRVVAADATRRPELIRLVANETGGDDNHAVLVTSTSWTPDEDIDLLLETGSRLDALIARHRASGAPFPLVSILITGDGALRSEYERRIAALPLGHVRIATAWLAPEQYPDLLAGADLGLSLHRSASKLDLPMKVSDMFGAGLPVCAFDYGPCIRELISPGVNGLLFDDAETLARQLFELFADSARMQLTELRRGAVGEQRLNWLANWNAIVPRLIAADPHSSNTEKVSR